MLPLLVLALVALGFCYLAIKLCRFAINRERRRPLPPPDSRTVDLVVEYVSVGKAGDGYYRFRVNAPYAGPWQFKLRVRVPRQVRTPEQARGAWERGLSFRLKRGVMPAAARQDRVRAVVGPEVAEHLAVLGSVFGPITLETAGTRILLHWKRWQGTEPEPPMLELATGQTLVTVLAHKLAWLGEGKPLQEWPSHAAYSPVTRRLITAEDGPDFWSVVALLVGIPAGIVGVILLLGVALRL